MLTTIDQFPEKETKLFISGPAGNIETWVELPRTSGTGITAIICHPHPQMGGTMNNKVVTTTARAMRELGVNTVRFNFRGVEQSAGGFANGIGESDDLLTVIQWVQQHRPMDIIWLAGFSFGSFVALKTITQIHPQLLLCIAPPVHYPEFGYLSSPACPWLVVQGEQDDVVNPEQVYAWVEQQQNRPTIVRLADAGHFFHGHLIALKESLISALAPFVIKGD